MDTLPETIQTLCGVGVREIKTSNIAMTELWRRHSEGNALTQEEYIEATLRYVPNYYKAGCPVELTLAGTLCLHRDGSYELAVKSYDGTEACLDCHMCGSTRWNCYITPEGRLLPCLPMTACPEQTQFPRIQDIGLRQGLSDSYYMRFVNGRVRELMEANQECAACPHRFRCGGGCRAIALMDGDQNLMGCDRIMCAFWKGGYDERILRVADAACVAYQKSRENRNE